jgi:choline dehydrogenase-like flavoprotein
LHDVIIVGSGPAGAAAALRLQSKDVIMLDVGVDAPSVPEKFDGNLFQIRNAEDNIFDLLIGSEFQGLENLYRRPKTNLKLKAPYMRFITDGWRHLTPIGTENFGGVISLSKGGLANGWGAGVYRFNDADLSRFPIEYQHIKQYYDVLTEHIGVSGMNDDLATWFIKDEGLQPPLKLSDFATSLLERYRAKAGELNEEGLYIGYPRLAVLTERHNGREAFTYDHMDFFRPRSPAVYSPAYTIDQLVSNRHLDYRRHWLVERFEVMSGHVKVYAKNTVSGQQEFFEAKKLLLGAGALNTSRIVLRSATDTKTKLPILDNPLSAFPILSPRKVGMLSGKHDSAVAQLNLILSGNTSESSVQSTIYTTNASCRTDVLFDFPLPVKSTSNLLKYTAAATGVVLTFYNGISHPENYVRLESDNSLTVNYDAEPVHGTAEAKIIRLLRKMGFLSHPSLVQRLPMGSALHYAGLLPMRESPGRYECFPDGQLQGSPGVHIIDGACFSSLPAKNLTFTIMANSMRIADTVSASL